MAMNAAVQDEATAFAHEGDDPQSFMHLLEQGAPWQPGRLRYHHGYELHLITAPHECAYIGDEVHRFAPGSVVLIGPRLPHNLVFTRAQGNSAAAAMHGSLLLRFSDEPMRRGMEFFPELRKAHALLERARRGVAFAGLGELVAKRFQGVKAQGGLARLSEFAALLHELTQSTDYRTLSSQPCRTPACGTSASSAHIYRTLDHIQSNYTDALTLMDVSAFAHLTPSAFSRQFRKVTGRTFTEFLVGLRVAEAGRLLLCTRKQVSSICYEVGFNNISNFNRHFRRLKKMTPGQYRAHAELE